MSKRRDSRLEIQGYTKKGVADLQRLFLIILPVYYQ